MNVAENNNYWDGIMNGIDPGVEVFSNILNMLDFPMESLEGDSLDGDLDPSNLGPIPMDALMGVTPFSQASIGKGVADMVPSYGALADTKSWPKERVNYVEDSTGGDALSKDLIPTEPSAFQTRSPVSVLESSGSCSSGKSLPVIAHRPVRARCKRARKPTVNPWLLISPIISRSGTNKEKTRKKLSRVPSALEAPENSHPKTKKQLLEQQRATKKCTHCEITKTPQWREGPLGPKTLCNACGVRYRSGRLFPEYRPAASPTFVPSLHSNSHKKVVAMRKQAMQQETVAHGV